jgi:amino acid transporter
MLVAQVHRYRRVSTSIERLQTRWVVFGSALSILIFMVAITVIILQEGELESRISPYWVLVTLAFYQVSLLIPIAIAVSVLRYRLWDIDLIIRRTLVYSLLTIALGLIYLGLVVFLQNLFGGLTGERQPEIVTVISTLAIAALFTPLRQRIQDFVDRRFYRRKYNAEQALSAFAALARNETDLDQLKVNVVEVLEQTVQPEHASLWLVRR